MFPAFARFISRYWILVLVAWVAVTAGLYFTAPSWDGLTHDGDFAYLPPVMTSMRGEELLAKTFPDESAKSSVVLIVARQDGRLTGADKAVASRLAEIFTPKEGEKTPIVSVMSHEQEVVGQKLVSRKGVDGQAVLVVLQLSTDVMAVDNMPFIEGIYRQVRNIEKEPSFPAGLQLGVTGTATVGSDMLWSMKESIDNTTYTTIVLVVLILLIVYRSPGLVMVPLVSIGVAYMVSIDFIAVVAKWCDVNHWDFQIFKTTQIFIVVILFGAATDYCLFLIARYREELERGLDSREALEEALGQTGHALTASAMTTILGLGAMVFADYGKYRSGGPTIAMSLIVALAACMTVAPALLRGLGRFVFWPFGVGGRPRAVAEPAPPTLMGRFWTSISQQIAIRPGLILVGSFLTMAVPAWYGLDVPITYDMVSELNPQRESVQGMRLLAKYFLVGETGAITVLAHRPGGNFDAPDERAKISRLAMELNDFVYTDSQGHSSRPIRYLRTLTNPLGEPLSDRNGKRIAYSPFSKAGRERLAAAHHPECKRVFLSGGEYKGEVTRMELVCDYDPFSQESMRLLGAVDGWLKEKRTDAASDWHGVDFDFVGITASMRDLDAVNRSDTFWVGVYVAMAVLMVLIVLIRRPLVSLYLIFTVVFGYLVSLGLAHIFFKWLYGDTYQGLDWKLKIFLFVILVAVGEDYNIYLVTRVFEEQRRRGLLPGLREAVVRTGGIITSCGVIMAGTFGSMATGTLRSMIELGFAMSLGVLLDTFIIRTILVPAFLAIPARWSRGSDPEPHGDVSAPHFDAASGDLLRASR